jgi:hypothetical protein
MRPTLPAILCFLFLAIFTGQSRADEITPPFGLSWGETQTRLEKLLAGAKATIVERRVLNGRDMWTVEGLVQTNLKCTIFYFKDGGLVEVELQYSNPNWVDTDYNSFLGQLRLKVENRYGSGKLIARSRKQTEEITQTLVGYQWTKNSAAIEIIYFSAESPSQSYRTVSLHYKAL